MSFDKCSFPASRSAFALALILGWTATAVAATRTWTDKSGKYKIEAEFVEVVDGQVQLKQESGKTISLPLTKLSKADQSYLREEAKRRKQQSDPNNPFNGGGMQAGPRGGTPAAPRQPLGMAGAAGGAGSLSGADFGVPGEPTFAVGDEVEIKEGFDWVKGKVVGVNDDEVFVTILQTNETDSYPAREPWVRRPGGEQAGNVATTPAGSVGGYELTQADLSSLKRVVALGGRTGEFTPDPHAGDVPNYQPFGLSPKRGFFESIVSLSFTGHAWAAVACTGGAEIGDKSSTIELCDLTAGRSAGYLIGPEDLQLLAVAPTGQRVATIAEVETFTMGPLQVWDVTDEGLQHVASWQASTDKRRGSLEWIGWLGGDLLATLDDNNLIAWSLAEDGVRGVYQIPVQRTKAPALSPGGNQLALCADGAVDIHDVADGRLLKRVAIKGVASSSRVAFSPAGDRLAVSVNSFVNIVDIGTGEVLCDAFAPLGGFASTLAWAGDDYVLVSGRHLVHIPTQTVAWTYEHASHHAQGVGGRSWYLLDNGQSNQRALLPFMLPHAAVTPPTAEDWVLTPGAKVALQLRLSPSYSSQGDFLGDVEKKLRGDLERAGFTVADDAPNRLEATLTAGESKTTEYRMFGRGMETQSVSVTQQVYKLELFVGGESMWSRRGVQDSPHHIQLKEGESVNQAVSRLMAPSAGFFGRGIPARILSKAEQERRTSELTVRGLK